MIFNIYQVFQFLGIINIDYLRLSISTVIFSANLMDVIQAN